MWAPSIFTQVQRGMWHMVHPMDLNRPICHPRPSIQASLAVEDKPENVPLCPRCLDLPAMRSACPMANWGICPYCKDKTRD